MKIHAHTLEELGGEANLRAAVEQHKAELANWIASGTQRPMLPDAHPLVDYLARQNEPIEPLPATPEPPPAPPAPRIMQVQELILALEAEGLVPKGRLFDRLGMGPEGFNHPLALPRDEVTTP
jgi:hypothetical protein